MQGCNSHRGERLRAWDGYWTLSASRLTLLLVTMSLIPGYWPWNADAGASSERERGSRWSSVFCYSRYLFFCPPLCGIMIRTDCTIQNKEDIQNIFHLTLQTMFFIDLLPPTTLLMLFISPLLNPYLCLNRWIRFVWPPKVIWSWHFVISDIRIKWDILATEWWMTIPPDKNRSQISLKYLLIC